MGRRGLAERSMSARPKTHICLNMIVKNEVEVLPRLFRSVKDYIDYFVIVDTGSTDDTIALIHREMSSYGIPGEVHQRPWVHFGHNRQQALELAVQADRADWLLFIDADEELGVSDPKFYEKLDPELSYDLEKHHGDMRYAVPSLVNVRQHRFRWEGPVHNYLVTLEGPKRRPLRKDVWVIYHDLQGAKSHGVSPREKYLRDAAILEGYLAEHPGHPRSQFYLGQSYRDAGELEKAQGEYQKRALMAEGWAEERFVAQLEVGKISAKLGRTEDIVLRDLLSAYNMRPRRAEPLHELARYFRTRQAYGMAALFAKAGVSTRRPDDQLFVDQTVYDWRMWDELAVASHWIGDFQACVEACGLILQKAEAGLRIPDGDLQRVRNNLASAKSKLTGE